MIHMGLHYGAPGFLMLLPIVSTWKEDERTRPALERGYSLLPNTTLVSTLAGRACKLSRAMHSLWEHGRSQVLVCGWWAGRQGDRARGGRREDQAVLGEPVRTFRNMPLK